MYWPICQVLPKDPSSHRHFPKDTVWYVMAAASEPSFDDEGKSPSGSLWDGLTAEDVGCWQE